MNKVKVALEAGAHLYQIKIGNELLKDSGIWAKDSLGKKSRKIMLVSNKKVFGLYGEKVRTSLENTGFEVFQWLMKDGEEFKDFNSLQELLGFLSKSKMTRTDAVVALGGGVVGDLAGFASAIYLRGISFLQIPTTLLAMIDSSVGGKTAVNSAFGKNLIGAFHQPEGVLIDVVTLKTLERRELTAGFCEAVKQGAVSGDQLFDKTAKFLEVFSVNDFTNMFSDQNFLKSLQDLLAAQVSFKAEIVMQDEREDAQRKDVKSRKILNFGHTIAHALEKATDYKYFKHGEAVGYGILFAAKLSNLLDIFDENRLKLLNDVVGRVGSLPNTNNINSKEIFQNFTYDKKFVGKSLQWILLEDIGQPVIFDNENIPAKILEETFGEVFRNNSFD